MNEYNKLNKRKLSLEKIHNDLYNFKNTLIICKGSFSLVSRSLAVLGWSFIYDATICLNYGWEVVVVQIPGQNLFVCGDYNGFQKGNGLLTIDIWFPKSHGWLTIDIGEGSKAIMDSIGGVLYLHTLLLKHWTVRVRMLV